MTTEELLAELARRGLRLELRESEPVLRGPKEQATPSLLRALRWHRDALRARLLASAGREWLWRDGHRYREQEGDWKDDWLSGHAERHPVGAWWVRQVGQTAWQSIPGRTPADVTALPAAA